MKSQMNLFCVTRLLPLEYRHNVANQNNLDYEEHLEETSKKLARYGTEIRTKCMKSAPMGLVGRFASLMWRWLVFEYFADCLFCISVLLSDIEPPVIIMNPAI